MANISNTTAPAAPAKKNTGTFIVQLPIMGPPICWGKLKGNADERMKQIQGKNGVGGYYEGFSKKDFYIHPMFVKEDPRWALAAKMLKLPSTKVWVNEEGRLKCEANVATILTDPQQWWGGCPYMFGNIVLEVNNIELVNAGYSMMPLVLVEEYEPYNQADVEAKKKECEEKGYDYVESCGYVYLHKC
jgi:hypothetical protein